MFEKYEYNKEIIERYISLIGESQTRKLLEANEKPLPLWIRVNTLKIKKSKLINKLEKKGFKLEGDSRCKFALKILKSPFSISSTKEYLLGYFYIQSLASMLSVTELGPKPKESILDVCSAPGGKSTFIAQLMKNKGVLVSVDFNKERVRELDLNLQRCGANNVICVCENAKKLRHINIKFDRILLDPPCSGDGTIRKNPKRKKLTNRDLRLYPRIQRKLIETCASLLKNNGVLVYSTCSLFSEENEDIINYAQDLGLKTEKQKRLWPHIDNTQGFFIARLRK